MEPQSNLKLATEPVGKLLFKLALPAVTAQLVNVLYNIVDRIYIGHIEGIGRLALTGVGVCMPLIMLISAAAALVSMGSAPRSSIKMGEGKTEEAEMILGNSFSLLVIVGVVLTTVFLLFGKNLLMLFGASADTIDYAWQYMSIYTIGTIFVQLALGLNAFISAQGFATTGMLTVLIGALLNIVLDPLFIFVFNMGVQGAALATILSQAVSAIWVVRFLRGEKTVLRLKKECMRLKSKVFLPCLLLGLAPFIMQATESILTMCFNSSLLKYGGDIAVGAMTILASVMQFCMLPLVGMTQGAQPIISYNFGAKNPERVRETFSTLLKVCMLYAVLLWAMVMLFPQWFAMLFNKDMELVSFTAWALKIYMATSFLFGLQLACQQTFIAIGNAKASLFLALLRKVILLIPFIYLFPLFMENKVMAVFLAEPVADFVAVTVTTILFYIQFRRTLSAMRGDLVSQTV